MQPADASATVNTDAGESAGEAASDNPQCAAFAADLDADVADIIRAGCQPSTAQMSKLMDNPLGNVAMLFTQFDVYQMKDPESGRREDKYNYMGIFSFRSG